MARTLQVQSRELAFLLLLLALTTVLHNYSLAQSTTTQRVVVPNLAGMLYPAQAQHSVEFGSSRTATLVSALVSDDGTGGSGSGASLATECPMQFCVDVVFTSEFEFDPFLLARYSSVLPTSCSLISANGGASQAASAMQPVIVGKDSRNSNNSSVREQTHWRFASNATSATTDISSTAANEVVPTVDVLLHLKQQSQFRARKDQLLIHVAVRRESAVSITTAVESFSLYGNERVTYETTRIDAKRVQIAFALIRGAAANDVVAEDAYPVVAVETDPSNDSTRWVYTAASECAPCAQQLYECASADALQRGACSYDITNAPLVACLRDHFHVTTAWFESQMATQPVGMDVPIQSMLSYCFDQLLLSDSAANSSSAANVRDTDWWRAVDALSCLASRRCPIGPLNSLYALRSPAKLIALTNETEFVYSLRIAAPTFSGSLAITFAASGSSVSGYTPATVPISETSPASAIVAAIQATIPVASGGVSVLKTFTDDAWALTISLRHLLFPNVATAFTLSASSSATIDASAVSETHAFNTVAALRVETFDATRLTLESTCDDCTAILAACQQSDACREQAVPCLVARLDSLVLSPAVLAPEFGTRRVDALSAFSECALTVPAATWSPVHRAFICLAQRQCAAGADPVTDAATVFQVANGTQTFVVSATEPGTNDVVALTFSHNTSLGSASHAFESSLSTLALFIRTFVLEHNGDVAVSSRADSDDATKLRVTLTYANVLGSLPTVAAAQDITWVQDEPARAYFEYPDDARMALATLLQTLRTNALQSSPIGAPSNHSWLLAPECLACSAQLFACDAVHVASRTCHYTSMTSRLGRCLVEQLPTTVFADVLNASSISSSSGAASSVVVRSEFAYCAQQAASAMPNAVVRASAAQDVNSALSCFVASKCPFGPLDVVHGDQVVLLETSSYMHLLRITTRTFQLTLNYRFRDDDSSTATTATASIDSTMTRTTALARVASALQASGVVPQLTTYENEAGGNEWTLAFRYDNVVVPTFAVVVGLNAEPAVATIQQTFVRGSPRLSIASRDPLKLFAQPADTSRDVSSSVCHACVEAELTACQRSRFCRTTVLPCFADRLDMSLGSAASDATEVDVIDWLLACASTVATGGVSDVAFYNWWAPFQRFLACYARSHCRVSSVSSVSTATSSGASSVADTVTPTVLRLEPGSETLHVPWTNASAGTFAVDVAPPLKGTSFAAQQSFAFVGTSNELERLLTYVTMDAASNITVDVAKQQDSTLTTTTVRISYGDDYVGLLPRLSTTLSGSSDGAQLPRLYFASSVAPSNDALDWTRLRDIVRGASAGPISSPSDECLTCEQTFLTKCRDLPTCSQQVLTCMVFAMSDLIASSAESTTAKSGLLPLGFDRDLLAGFNCFDMLPPSMAQPALAFLDCFEQAQCAANELSSVPATASPSYIRLQRGRIRASVPVPSASDAVTFAASLEALRTSFAPLEASTGATVVLETWQPPATSVSADTQHVQVVVNRYYGALPVLPLPFEVVTPPRLVLYTASNAAPLQTQLTGTIARYIVRPECTSVCSNRIASCESGASQASLMCREAVLPCLTDQLASASALAQSATAVDVAAMLRVCAAGSIIAGAAPVADFVTCYHGNRCPLNVQDVSVAPTFLQLRPGSETLEVSPTNDTTYLTIHNPSSDASSVEFALSDGEFALQTLLEYDVLASRASVSVSIATAPDMSSLLVITYSGGYLGSLPIITGIGVQSLARVLPQASTVSTLMAQPPRWDLLNARLASRVQTTTSKRIGCSSCATTHLSNCAACATILQCLTQLLQSPGANDLVAVSSGTGTDFSPALRTCVAPHAAADWLGLGTFFTCLMDHACPVGAPLLDPRSANATFVITQDANYSFDVIVEQLPLAITLVIPPDLGGGSSAVQLDHSNGYTELLKEVNAVLVRAGVGASGLVTLTVTTSATSTAQTVTLSYHGYYGQILTIAPIAGVTVTMSKTAQFVFQSLGETPKWDAIYAIVSPYVSSSPAPTPS